jgi:hypothetical protein
MNQGSASLLGFYPESVAARNHHEESSGIGLVIL